ncbi:MAG: FAD-dependent oxidoreductase [Akkermansiaceae bacterium]|nr:FAD-dependent oxidoreductase [Akkermansiaceae bacterium]
MPKRGDKLIIVGGGIIGLSTAVQAQEAGFEVTLLERGGELGPNCSSANAGMIVPSHFTPLAAPGVMAQGLRWLLNPESPFAIRPSLSPDMARWGWLFYRHSNARHVAASRELLCELHMESRQLFLDWAKQEDYGLETRGLLMLCRDPEVLEEEAKLAEQARKLGLRTEVLDPAGVAKLEPDIDIDVAGAVFHAEDAHLDPARLLTLLKRRFTEGGGHIHYHCPIGRLERAKGRIRAVHGPGGSYEADHFVVAGGSWTPELLRDLGLRLPLQPGKGYSLTLEQPAQLPTICSLLAEARVAITPMGSKLRVAGTMEIGGLNLDINPRRIQGIIKSVQHYYPAIKEDAFDTRDPWVGLRPVSPDGLPYLGPAPGIDNLIIATGHAMMGLSLAPVTGKRVSAMLSGDAPVPQLDPARFG